VDAGPSILVTGATGKVGQTFIRRVLSTRDERFAGFTVRALCHNRLLEPAARLEVVEGSIDRRAVVDAATNGVTHVLHLATSKETPETIFDVAVKGLFWLLEACRVSPTFRRLVLVGGDAASGTSSIRIQCPSPRRSRGRRTPAATRSRRCSRR
jgi:uncharacterized protein YbjT (DUF2867 family)